MRVKKMIKAMQNDKCYKLPFCSLYNEDCIETMKRISDGSIDLLLQDTPFGCTQNEWDIKPNFPEMWLEWERIIKDNGAIIFFGTQPFTSELILSNTKLFRYDLIWYKALGTGFLNANKMPMRNHEHILVFYKFLPVYNPQMGVGLRKKGIRKADRNGTNYGKFAVNKDDYFDDEGKRFPQSVIDFSNGDRTSENDHPTQKPLDLMRYLILTYSNKGETVFDGYSGSGTTAEACIIEGRKFIGSELNEGYFTKSVERLKNVPTQIF
jgi:site-specific DNA-methyltransferase (adenine-specific)